MFGIRILLPAIQVLTCSSFTATRPLFTNFPARYSSRSFATRTSMSTSNIIESDDELTTWLTQMYAEFNSCTNPHTTQAVEAFWDTYMLDDEVMCVRPSTNPIGKEGYAAMAASKAITDQSGDLVEVKHIKYFAGKTAAVAYFEGTQKFNYEGNPVDDNAMYSATIEKQADGKLKMIFFQRYPGVSNI